MKIQCTHISNTYAYVKFRHVPELSHSVPRGTNPPQKTPPPYFFPSPLQIVQAPLLRQFPIYIFCDRPPLNKKKLQTKMFICHKNW